MVFWCVIPLIAIVDGDSCGEVHICVSGRGDSRSMNCWRWQLAQTSNPLVCVEVSRSSNS